MDSTLGYVAFAVLAILGGVVMPIYCYRMLQKDAEKIAPPKETRETDSGPR